MIVAFVVGLCVVVTKQDVDFIRQVRTEGRIAARLRHRKPVQDVNRFRQARADEVKEGQESPSFEGSTSINEQQGKA